MKITTFIAIALTFIMFALQSFTVECTELASPKGKKGAKAKGKAAAAKSKRAGKAKGKAPKRAGKAKGNGKKAHKKAAKKKSFF